MCHLHGAALPWYIWCEADSRNKLCYVDGDSICTNLEARDKKPNLNPVSYELSVSSGFVPSGKLPGSGEAVLVGVGSGETVAVGVGEGEAVSVEVGV